MKSQNVWHKSLLSGAILIAINFAYQTFLWFSGLNEVPAALIIFFLFFPAVLGFNFYQLRNRGENYISLLLSGLIISVMGGLGILAMLYFYLNIVGGGVLPPVFDAEIARLELDRSAGKDVSTELNAYREMTATGFAVASAAQNALIGIMETVAIAAVIVWTVSRPGEI